MGIEIEPDTIMCLLLFSGCLSTSNPPKDMSHTHTVVDEPVSSLLLPCPLHWTNGWTCGWLTLLIQTQVSRDHLLLPSMGQPRQSKFHAQHRCGGKNKKSTTTTTSQALNHQPLFKESQDSINFFLPLPKGKMCFSITCYQK